MNVQRGLPVIEEVIRERERQNAKWGIQTHNAGTWLSILMEEVGEASRATHPHELSLENYRKELIHVAAVAVATVEDFDHHVALGEDPIQFV